MIGPGLVIPAFLSNSPHGCRISSFSSSTAKLRLSLANCETIVPWNPVLMLKMCEMCFWTVPWAVRRISGRMGRLEKEGLTGVTMINNVERRCVAPGGAPVLAVVRRVPVCCMPHCTGDVSDVNRVCAQVFGPEPLHFFAEVSIDTSHAEHCANGFGTVFAVYVGEAEDAEIKAAEC